MSKYPRTYHLHNSLGKTSDDKVNYNLDSILGYECVITEKLDGGNIGLTNDHVFERSHAVPSKSPWTLKVRQLHDMKIRGHLDDGVFLFGEGMEAIHSIEYTNLDFCFYLFGVRDNGMWLRWNDVIEYSYLLDIPTVPILYRGFIDNEKQLNSLVKELVNQPSSLGGEREGIVIRRTSSFNERDFKDNVLKWVRKNHVKTDIHWSRNWKKSKIKENYY